MNLTFIETRVFSARWHKRLDAEALRAFQNFLLANPDAGDSIKGCGLLRKVRFGDEGRGKGRRGGVRVIYMHTPAASQIDLITVYGKDEADNLTARETELWCVLARAVRAEATARAKREAPIRQGRLR